MALTDRAIAGVKAPAMGRVEVADGENGLVVRVSASGEKALGCWWRIPQRFGAAASKGFITFGTWPEVALVAARRRAAEVAEWADRGLDPRERLRRRAEEKRKAADDARALTVLAVVKRHFDARQAILRPATLDQYTRTIATLKETAIAHRPLPELNRGEVREALRVVYRERGPGAARKVKTLVRAAAKWAAAEDLVPHDVLSGLRLAEVEPRERTRVLSDAEILTLWRACDDAPAVVAASLRLQLVLALRHPSETTTMRWSDLTCTRLELRQGARTRLEDVTVYGIPAERRKHGVAHSLPLPPLAEKILDALRPMTGSHDLVLDGWTRGRELHWWRRGLKRTIAAAGVLDVTRHDLRRSAASGMTRIGVPASAADVVLGHVLRGSARSYLHGARLVEAASALWRWSDHLERLLRGPGRRRWPT